MLPKIKCAAGAAKAMAGVLDAVADGELTPGEAEQVAKLIDTFARTLEVTEFEQRLRALEEKAVLS